MTELVLRYSRKSPKKMTRMEKMQLLLPGLTLFLIGMETFSMTEQIFRIIASANILVGIIHVVFFVKYDYFKQQLGKYFARSLYYLAGSILIIDGISYFYQGKNLIPYITIILGLFYIFVLERLIASLEDKLKIAFNEEGIAIGRMITKRLVYQWEEVIRLVVGENTFQLLAENGNAGKVLNLTGDSTENRKQLSQLLESLGKKNMLETKD